MSLKDRNEVGFNRIKNKNMLVNSGDSQGLGGEIHKAFAKQPRSHGLGTRLFPKNFYDLKIQLKNPNRANCVKGTKILIFFSEGLKRSQKKEGVI